MTKILEFYLDCLENDDYEKLPQGPYIKGYISSYATLIGGNAEEALKLYASAQKQRSHANELSPKKPKANGKRGAITSSIKAITLLSNRKNNQDEIIQSEKSQDNGWQASTALSLRKIGASFNAIGSSAKTNISLLKSAVIFPKKTTALLKSTAASIKKTVSTLQRVTFLSKSSSFF